MDDLAEATTSGPSENGFFPHPNALPRGRHPKDPLLQTAKFQCSSIEEFEVSLKFYLDGRPTETVEHSTCELTIWAGASFMVSMPRPDLATTNYNNNGMPTMQAGPMPPVPAEKRSLSVLEALMPGTDPKESMKKQRAIAKVCIESIQKVDGYRYAFHNNWRSGEEDAYRFSYYCNDSLLNKDRVANGKAGTQGKHSRTC